MLRKVLSTGVSLLRHIEYKLSMAMERRMDSYYLMRIKKSVHLLAEEIRPQNTILQTHYVVEECAELIQAIIKDERGKCLKEDVIDEACDVLVTVFTMLYQNQISIETIEDKITFKCRRAVQRFKNKENP